jgi:alpha-glucuronidase
MKPANRVIFVLVLVLTCNYITNAEDGYRLWLRYDLVSNPLKLNDYRQQIQGWIIEGNSPTLAAAKHELHIGLDGLLGEKISEVSRINGKRVLIATNFHSSRLLAGMDLKSDLDKIGTEGFLIFTRMIAGTGATIITANSDIGVLYGVFHFLRLLQTQQDIAHLNIVSFPRIKVRVLDHWDNLNGTVERGYAGFSIFDWHTLPIYRKSRYTDYARANASIGINGAVMNNVNADPLILTHPYLVKAAALADVFRPYGIKLYVCANFDAPIVLGKLKSADPLDTQVRDWWKKKAQEIYSLIPDFGGFLVKANSEGQPGPREYGRTQAEGANALAEAVRPFGGIIMWRAFVYSYDAKDRAKQAFEEFTPLDGKFADNVLLQVKNGPLDFQPREPFSPLFGAMPKTNMMMEFQITMEYLGQGTSSVYLAPLFKETLDSDTYAKGKGSTVARVIDGSLDDHSLTGVAGVSNIGADRNWTGNIFGQSSWYAFGRLAWNHALSSREIADEWIRMTLSNDKTVVESVERMMLPSRETVVNYMDPLGLTMIFGYDFHYGPGPWIDYSPHPDWNSTYYHRADSIGVGFDRTKTGSDAVSQYHAPLSEEFNSLADCPSHYLLWFHHVPWDFKMKSGNTLWNDLCDHYYEGVDSVRAMQKTWESLKGMIDDERWHNEEMLLTIQEEEAVWWRNSCLLYFQTFSRMPIPKGFEKPNKTLEYYESLSFPYAPGRW